MFNNLWCHRSLARHTVDGSEGHQDRLFLLAGGGDDHVRVLDNRENTEPYECGGDRCPRRFCLPLCS